jgi:ABC-type sugar transport system permease subunit
MWLGVNINSIFLTFKSFYNGKLVWVFQNPTIWDGDSSHFWSTLFYNYATLFQSFSSPDTQSLFSASLVYFVISCLITLPISMVFSYFVFKKIAGNAFFKVIFFLPCILPLFILTMVYSLSLSPNGFIAGALKAMHVPIMGLSSMIFSSGIAPNGWSGFSAFGPASATTSSF